MTIHGPVAETAIGAERVKHLELIQAVISRLGGNGFAVKGWAITIAAAFFGFAINQRDPMLAIASILPSMLFWGLDAYFLRAERLFRELYEQSRKPGSTIPLFWMAATSTAFASTIKCGKASFTSAFFSTTLWLFYGSLIGGTAVIVAIITTAPSPGIIDPSPSPAVSPP